MQRPRLLKQTSLTPCGHIAFAWRAASTVNIPEPPPPITETANTFVKYTGATQPTTSTTDNVYSAPIDTSQTPEVPSTPILDSIPEPPSLPVSEVTEVLNVAGEPTFASIGLGGWTPVGIVQNCLEYLHITCDLPWWTAIMIGIKLF